VWSGPSFVDPQERTNELYTIAPDSRRTLRNRREIENQWT
jgi:hypothetical protein